jgi:hypothetical protein
MCRFAAKNDHHARKTRQRDCDLRRDTKSFARFHGHMSSTCRRELWKHFLSMPVATSEGIPVDFAPVGFRDGGTKVGLVLERVRFLFILE